MLVEELVYDLPKELIAKSPPEERDGARMLLVNRAEQSLMHSAVRQLADFIAPGTVMVVNNTKVLRARLRGKKQPSNGAVELFLLRVLSDDARRWTAFGRASKALKPGTIVRLNDRHSVTVIEKNPSDGVLTVEFASDVSPWAVIEECGEVPLPPYMERAPDAQDESRYQTVFAEKLGAVAAPTAGLHVTERILADLQRKHVRPIAVTLHVGAGTFQPVAVDDLDKHPMHSEYYELTDEVAQTIVQAKREGRPIFAVGTTVVRALESWALGEGPQSGETRLLLQPGSSFRVVDLMLTNFHLPRSTLLALVMAFAGKSLTRRAYELAVAERYRFFSYGDAMLIR